jgi:hypothetical protein
MPFFQASLAEVNARFQQGTLKSLGENAHEFAAGGTLTAKHLLGDVGSQYEKDLERYLRSLPPAHQEVLRAVYHHAVTADPPRHVTFAWATAYDFEIDVWDMPCGITVLVKSRYPGDTNINRAD